MNNTHINIKRLGTAMLMALACTTATLAENVRTYTTTAQGTKKLERRNLRTTKRATSNTNCITLHADTLHQSMDGFGYAITYSSCYNLMKMTPKDRYKFLLDTFSPNEGYGVSYARISIGCSDFSSTEYSLCDEPGLEHFRLYSDETDYVIPVLKEILAINPHVKIMAAPWTCPKWMKVENLTTLKPHDSWTSGHLAPKYRQTYADYFVRFVQAFQAEGIPIYAVTPQNEPLNQGNCASLYLPWAEEAEFIKYLAPAFKKAGLDTKIYCFDHNWNYDNKKDQQSYPVKVFNVLNKRMEGSELVVGSAWHDYGGEASELDNINKSLPDKEVIFTEASIGTWNDGRNLGTRLLTDMNRLVYNTVSRECRAVMVWNLMLDLQRGPNLDGGCTTCYGAVDIDQNNYKTITRNSHYYIIAHSSAVVQPDAKRIGQAIKGCKGIGVMSFLNPDSTVATLLINNNSEDKSVSIIKEEGVTANITVPAKSVTSVLIGPAELVPTKKNAYYAKKD